MIQTLKRWKIVVDFGADPFSRPPITFYIYDNFLSNVQRKVADLHFSRGLDPEPTSITISENIDETSNYGSVTYGSSSITG